MRIQEALREIAGLHDAPTGYVVSFHRPVDGKAAVGRGQFISTVDRFPDIDAGEMPIRDEEEAWALAEAFAAKTAGWTRWVTVCPVPHTSQKRRQSHRYFNPEWLPAPLGAFES